MKNKYLFLTLLFFIANFLNAQVGIGTTSPDVSSELDITSPLNNKGVLIPRMTLAQKNAITTPATSLLVYQTDGTPGFYYYTGTMWNLLQAGVSTDWSLLGNAGTSAATNFMGTTDDVDVVFKRFGVRAGYIGNPNNPSGNRNTSFGANSLLAPSATGIRNTAFGTNSLTANTTGNRNVSIGDAAMELNTSGQQNTAVGVGALYFNKLGNSNVAIGRNALTSTDGTTGTQASNNTAVGMISMELNTIGAYNSALGRESLYNNLSGNNNVGIGWKAGFANSTGSNNVSLGNSAGLNNTGSNNTSIGALSEVPVLANSDQLSIGNVIYGTTMSTTALGKIGIGENNPSAKLQISSSNQAAPAITDGILIPKVNNLAAVPTAAQQGMLVYLTTLAGTNQPGFYYWNNTPASWIGLLSSQNGDADWFKVGTTTAPTLITDDMFHTGNVAVGKNTIANAKLDVETNSTLSGINNLQTNNSNSALFAINNTINGTGSGDHLAIYNSLTGNGVGAKVGIRSQITSTNTGGIYGVNNILNGGGTSINYGIYTALFGNSSGAQYGAYNDLTNSSTGNHYGNYNTLNGSGNTVGGSSHYGNYNLLSGTGTTNKYGSYNRILDTAGGTHYGVYSEVLKAGATNFAGYFLGNVGIGTTVANTYTLPASRGTNLQIMQSNGTGGVTWQNPSAALNSAAWLTTGNSGMTANFLGTTDANPLIFATTSTERMRIFPTGEVLIGTGSPFSGDKLTVFATGALVYAVSGYSTNTGVGIFGDNTSTGYGVYGNNSSTGVGVYGNNSSTGVGVEGDSAGTGLGVLGFNNGTGVGVLGFNSSTGYAVQGNNTSTGFGVGGFSSGTNGAVYGQSTVANGIGTRGFTNGANGFGLYGTGSGAASTGVFGLSSGTGLASGVWGRGTTLATGTGVIGAGNGIVGTVSTNGSGGAFAGTNFGTVSYSTTVASGIGIGAAGNNGTITTLNAFGAGGAFSATRYGVTSFASITGAGNNGTDRATFFGQYTSVGTTTDNVYVGARIGGTHYKILGTGGGSVSTTMPTTQGERILFAPEATENWFFDMGEVQLVNGRATVQIDPIFLETISDSKPFKVFVQGAEETLGSIRITRDQKLKSFILEDTGGASNGTVMFSVYGIWKGKENLRMPVFDSSLKYQTKVLESKQLDDPSSKVDNKPITPTTSNLNKRENKR